MKIGSGLTVRHLTNHQSRNNMGEFWLSLNIIMMKAKVSPNLISFVTIRRGNWVMKISVYKTRWVLLVAQHYYDKEKFIIKQFSDHNEAASFIDFLAESDYDG